jgi:predicted PhzF superfamily epimerase YddE/YHI9
MAVGATVPVTVVRVFCGGAGSGNPLGVVLDGPVVAADDRQEMARLLGYSETVFVDDREQGRIRIFTPAVELPLAGHPLVGTGWLLRREGEPAERLLTPAGEVGLRHEAGSPEMCWATARPEWCPPFELVQLGSAAEVEAAEPGGAGWSYVWAWIDAGAGTVRARCFVDEAGIPEDEATGSAALRLCAELGRPIEVRQGRGSVISARPLDNGRVEIGGRVEPG